MALFLVGDVRAEALNVRGTDRECSIAILPMEVAQRCTFGQ
jgi:hypothetical protein